MDKQKEEQAITERQQDCVGVNIDATNMTDAGYFKLWEKVGKLQLRCIEKHGNCIHNVGDTYYYDRMPFRRPEKVCYAVLHVMEMYTWRAALGFPSWNEGDRDTYKIHCPDRTGTVWELKRVE